MEDLQSAGKYSPVSLKKFLTLKKDGDSSKLQVLIDNSGLGFVNDAPSVMSITAQDCSEQAAYFRDTFFPDRIPEYVLEYMNGLFYYDKKIPTEEPLEAIMGMIEYCKTNKEASQCIGLIILLHDSLVLAKHYNKWPTLYIEYPETNLHPKREAAVMSMIYDIFKKFDINLKDK